MNKTKKKTAKLPKPIKVKKEKSDEDRLPQPMTHYIDDRLELVKQVFGTLKPKTIVNLAPEFLKTQELEDIEEACLNELLCISTKRLKSIITGTKCPTDTESSDDNDDDVERQEEHVSLEEISSDSEIEGGGSSKKAKKKKISKAGDKTNSKTDKSKTDEGDGDNNTGDGQISVLELLELQARARAIRSQLALEPVTKIEVDSDGDAGKEKSPKQKSKKDKKSSHKSSERKASIARESEDTTNPKTRENESERKTKKIKLKRNYRNASSSTAQTEEEEKGGNAELSQQKANKAAQENDDAPKAIEKLKKERGSRSASPDVIPIVAEPETLLINDSSDEADGKEAGKALANDNTEVSKGSDSIEAPVLDSKNEEAEEGEICTEENNMDGKATPNARQSPKNNNEQNQEKEMSNPTNENIPEKTDTEKMKQQDAVDVVTPTTSNRNTSPAMEKLSSADADEDEDQNDDIISLGEDLEDEMNEQLQNEVNASSFTVEKSEADSLTKSKKKSRKDKASEDDQSADNQSWHSRYMKSSKVSKVLAASRLGKRVRDKIKKSKDAPRENVAAEKEEPVFSSKHEDGSLEQYNELLELRNRKSK